MTMDYMTAVGRASVALNNHYYLVGEKLDKHEDFRRGFVLALAMIYESAPQTVEQMMENIGEEL